MRIYYIDAENVGLSAIDHLTIAILDRVFVFTNSDSLKSACANALFTCVTDYPSGANQADFYIIAHLSNILAHLSKAEKKAIEFILCSKDQSLWKAFEFQCKIANANASASHIKIDIEPSSAVIVDTLMETEILKNMGQPIKSIELQQKLQISQSEFTISFNNLIKSGKIKRQDESKNKWLRVSSI